MIRLTQEYLKGVKEKVVFRPVSQSETQYIVQQMALLGFHPYSANQLNRLPLAANSGTLYLDTDKTLMVGGPEVIGIEASVTGFDSIYLDKSAPPARISDDEIRKEVFAFFPRTMSEAAGIIEKLRSSGAKFAEEKLDPLTAATRAVAAGLVVREGRITMLRDGGDLGGAKISTAADLGMPGAISLSPEQAAVMSAFNEMSARLQQVTSRMEQMDERMQKMEAEILPKTLEKKSPSLPKPSN